MVRAGRIARRGADAAIALGDQRLVVEVLVRRIAPELLAHPRVQRLGEGLGQPVAQRLHQDRVVVVALGLEPLRDLVDLRPTGHGEAAEPVGRALGRDEIGQTHMRAVARLAALLAQHREAGGLLPAILIGPDDDVVAAAVGRP